MTKKRMAAIGILSPLLASMAIMILLVSFIGYATSGKWTFKDEFKELFTA